MTETNVIPELSELVDSARSIVLEAKTQDKLHLLTVNEIKKQLEQKFSLKQGTLKDARYKEAIRRAIKDAAFGDQLQPKEGQKPIETNKNREEEVKEDVKHKETKVEAERKAVKGEAKDIQDKVSPFAAETSQAPAKKVAKMPKPEDRGRRDFALSISKSVGKKTEVSKAESTKGPRSKFKSREYIEDDDENDSAITDSSGNGGKSSSEESASSESERDKKRKRKPSKEGSRKRSKDVHDSDVPAGDEATVKKYKAYVSACGARKKWAKEFENYPKPKQQIQRLKEMLAELGMKGKYSMEKAKQIKRKRDLARELEDVIEFERKAGVSRDRRKKRDVRSGRPIGELDTETEGDSDPSDAEEKSHQPASIVINRYLKKKIVDDESSDS